MEQRIEKALGWAAMAAVGAMAGWLMGLAPANAAPPSSRAPSVAESRTPPARQLDLRAPGPASLAADDKAANSVSFSSSGRTDTWGTAAHASFNLGESDARELRGPPNMAEMALRMHREGLPLVRLWQGNSALVHLGLNAKGKPGLWLLQKTH